MTNISQFSYSQRANKDENSMGTMGASQRVEQQHNMDTVMIKHDHLLMGRKHPALIKSLIQLSMVLRLHFLWCNHDDSLIASNHFPNSLQLLTEWI